MSITWRILILAALFSLYALGITAFTVRIPSHEQQCYFDDLVKDQKISISYQVAEGGSHWIDFWASGPDHVLLHIANRDVQGNYQFTASKDGRYSYCFGNQMSDTIPKTLQFSVAGADQLPTDVKAIVDPVLKTVEELSTDIHSIKEEQQFVVTREKWHRNTAESTNSRVMYWSLLQTALLVGVCVFQVYYVQRIFEIKRVL